MAPRQIAELTGLDAASVKWLLDDGQLPVEARTGKRGVRRVRKSAVLAYQAQYEAAAQGAPVGIDSRRGRARARTDTERR